MCEDCGCSQPGPYKIDGQPETAASSPLAPAHSPSHSHGPDRDHPQPHEHRNLEVNQTILASNDRLAERNRGFFKASKTLTLNVLASPGSGKTTLIQKTLEALTGRLKAGVVVGDLATDNDATRLRATGAPVVQITTGTLCHLEADMVAKAMAKLDLQDLDLLIIENVGNLVCPASFDLGEALRVVLLSATEGEDKPLKYPPMFHSADAVVVTKIDMAQAADFQRETALANLHRVSHHARIFELSARTGDGMDAWCDFLIEACQREG
jgi:hydrogenase nickel incorporation protein HypB